MFVDLPLEELEHYRPAVREPDDFDDFWTAQLAAARTAGAPAQFVAVETPLALDEVFDVTFAGHGGTPVRAWLLVPRDAPADRPVVVEFIGYGGGRGDPLEWLGWSAAGYPHFVMDTRGQGGGSRRGDTFDTGDAGAPATPGFMTRGIADAKQHYFTRLFIDAALAVDAATAHPATAGRRVVVTGRSQGGGLSLAAAHLNPGVAAALPDVAFLAHFRRALQITDALPYGELVRYCAVRPGEVDNVFRTLSYIDVANHAKRAQAPALFSVGLVDEITPPSTVFAAYNYYAGAHKQIAVYPFNGHEGGGVVHFRRQLAFLAELG